MTYRITLPRDKEGNLFKKKKLCVGVCLHVCLGTCMCMCWVPVKAEEGIRSGTGVTSGCESPCR